jgi:hypothetical protein
MYLGELRSGNDGPVELDKRTRISEPQGMWMFDVVRRLKPKRSLEIGLAYGFGTIYILAAIEETGAGHHLALDPFQAGFLAWSRCAASQASRHGTVVSGAGTANTDKRRTIRLSTQTRRNMQPRVARSISRWSVRMRRSITSPLSPRT